MLCHVLLIHVFFCLSKHFLKSGASGGNKGWPVLIFGEFSDRIETRVNGRIWDLCGTLILKMQIN